MKKLIAMMLMLASVFFFACSDDDDVDKKLSKEEAKTEITQLSTDLSDKLTEMEESDGMVAMESLMKLNYPFVTSKSDKKSAVLNNIQKYLLPYNYVNKSTEKSALELESFDFDSHTGTYEWIDSLGRWKIDPTTPPDKIIIIFPADTNNLNNNNATLTIHNYNDILINLVDSIGNQYTEYYPTDVDIDLYISEIKIIDIDLTAAWNTSGDNAGEPTSLDVSVYLIPFEFTGDFTHTSTEASINFAINYENEQFFSAGVGATWANAGDSIPNNINGYLQLFNVKFQVDIDVLDLIVVINNMATYGSEEEFLNAINDEINAYVTVDGTWAADIELGLVTVDGKDELDILFVYADGTSESAKPYFEEFITEMGGFFDSLEDYYSNW